MNSLRRSELASLGLGFRVKTATPQDGGGDTVALGDYRHRTFDRKVSTVSRLVMQLSHPIVPIRLVSALKTGTNEIELFRWESMQR